MFHMYYGFPGRPVLPGMQIQHILISWWGRKVLEPPSDHPAQLIRFTEFSMVYLVLSPSSLLSETENISIKMRIFSSVEDLCAHDIFRVLIWKWLCSLGTVFPGIFGSSCHNSGPVAPEERKLLHQRSTLLKPRRPVWSMDGFCFRMFFGTTAV